VTFEYEPPPNDPPVYFVRGVGINPWTWQEPLPRVTHRPGDFAHGVWTAVAATLAAPLRRAFDEHLDEHGCAQRGGFGYCEEAMHLYRLQPQGDQPPPMA
jgi:hypothetical protein